jgi:hypothetical protein
MVQVAESTTGRKNAHRVKAAPSELGRKLRRISEKFASSGEKLLTRRELEQELAARRGGIR